MIPERAAFPPDAIDDDLTLSPRTFRTVFEQSPISTQILAPDGRTIAVNRAWEELWGVTVEQIAGYNILADSQLVERGVMPYIRRGFGGEAVSIPPVKYVPNETIPGVSTVPYRWVSGFIYPVRDAGGTIRQVVLTHEDITEKVKAEEALRESEARFRATFSGAPVGISLVDREGRYLAVNPARQRMLGYTEEELLGRLYWDLTYPEDVEYDERVNREARQQGRDVYQLEKRFVHKDGTIVWTRITVAAVRNEQGELLYSISIAEDITAHKLAQETLQRLYAAEREARAKEQKLAAEREAILGQIGEGIVMADAAGKVVFVNEAALSIAGVDGAHLDAEARSTMYQVTNLDGSERPNSQLTLGRAALHGETVRNERWRIVRPDGREIVAEGTAAPVVAKDGTRLGAVLSFRDVTEQFDLERQKDEFLSAAAHDLRTPLTTIKGRIQLLLRRVHAGKLDETGLSEELSRIDLSATRMITLINELLDVANIQIGRPLKLTRRPTDLVALARFVASEHSPVPGKHPITVESDGTELVGLWDEARLERMLANLLSNAIKYSPDGGSITVRVRRENRDQKEWAWISVSDQGIGIPEADLPYVFDRFHRGMNVSGKIAGTGIGLAAVKEIVEQHGGTVSVSSVEGQGTTFQVRLPLSPSSA